MLSRSMTYDELIGISPYSLSADEKEKLLTERLTELTRMYQANCPEYRRMLEVVGFDVDESYPGHCLLTEDVGERLSLWKKREIF